VAYSHQSLWGVAKDDYIFYFYVDGDDILSSAHVSPLLGPPTEIKLGLCELDITDDVIQNFSDHEWNYLITSSGRTYRSKSNILNMRSSFEFEQWRSTPIPAKCI